jgi:hypothetical protein
MEFGLNDGYSGLHPLLGPLDGVGPENLNFFGPKWHLLSSWPFQGQKSLDFQGPPLPMALKMDVA